ncbi:MAG TPA: hypothetical protein VG847_11240 [Chitinophagaceae bacterium]|nr:hypothetical protein [Chitinophagaceae bacterium]
MKKIMFVWMLFTGILTRLCAQTNNKSDQTFEVPENIVFNRKFNVDLGNGNKMQILLSDINDLKSVGNVDSILQVFLEDLRPLKDSFSDPISSKHIDYITDAKGRKKIRLQQHAPKGASYLIDKSELSSLRTEQDTINIIGIIINPLPAQEKISLTNLRYYEYSFYLNSLDEITAYMNGVLTAKIITIENDVNGKWPTVLGTGSHYLKTDKTITADKPKGFTTGGNGDMLELNVSAGVQNYKNYFVPSFSLGAKIVFSNRERTYKWEPGLFWEPQFLFSRDAQNRLRTYRNDFLTLVYGQGGIKDHDPAKDFSFSAVFSLGYLINRSGDFYEKNTFRLGAGKINLAKTTIEPLMYFNNFFKGVTPGIRISQYL